MAEKQRKVWLMKTEPDVFSFEDLLKSPARTAGWEGVRNYQARNFMRDEFSLKDLALIYHSSVAEPCVMGIAEVVRKAYPDVTALNPKSPYFDEKAAAKGESPWVLVDVRAVSRFETPVFREAMKKEPQLKNMVLLQKGSRLSIQPVKEAEFAVILKMGGAVKL